MPAITFSGLASGIDADAIIKAAADARRLPLAPLKSNREANERENTALEEFNTKLLGFGDKLDGFLTLRGSAIEKTALSSDTDVIGATATSAAAVSSTDIEVVKLARTAAISFSDRHASAVEPLAPQLSGTAELTLRVGGGEDPESYRISVTSTTTLAQLAEEINASVPGARATVINAGTESNPSHILSISGSETGTEKGTLAIDVPVELSGQGVLADVKVIQATDAVIRVPGLGEIARSRNQISDIVPGVTLVLKREGGVATVSVSNNEERSAEAFGEAVTAFNELVQFAEEKSVLDRVEEKGESIIRYGDLARIRVDDQAVDAIRMVIRDARSTLAGAAQTFADIGIATERNGTLNFDREKFLSATRTDPRGVDDLLHSFADRVAATDGVIDNYTRFQGQIEVARRANDDENTRIDQRIERVEAAIEKETEALRRVFTNLETTVGRLNSQASALQSFISSTQAPRR